MLTFSDPFLLRAAIYVALDTNIPLNIFGSTGIGKSTIVAEVAKEWADDIREKTEFATLTKHLNPSLIPDLDFFFCDLRLAHQDISDWGIPLINSTTGVSTKTCPSWIPRNKNSIFVLFADEMNRGTTEAMNAMMSITMERTLGAYSLPTINRLVAACNPSTGPYDTGSLDEAMKARWCHILFQPTTSSYLKERNDYLDPALSSLLLKSKILDSYQKESLEGWDIKGEVSPCPRTFEMTTKLSIYYAYYLKTLGDRKYRYFSEEKRQDLTSVLGALAKGLLGQEIGEHWESLLFDEEWKTLDFFYSIKKDTDSSFFNLSLLRDFKKYIPILEEDDLYSLREFSAWTKKHAKDETYQSLVRIITKYLGERAGLKWLDYGHYYED